jgi:glycosyltransferase involved in cell wall biosynthesis
VREGLRVAWLGHQTATLGGGMATYSHETIARLRQRGVKVTFFHHDAKESAATPADDEVPLAAYPLMRSVVLSPPRARRALIERLESHAFDLVHASFWFSSLDFDLPKLCHRLGIPILATFHVAFDARISVWGGLTNAAYRLYAPALADCDGVIVFGRNQRDLLAGLGVPEEKLSVLPNGVDVDKYCPGSADWKRGVEADRLFVYLGRLDAEKNVDELLDAFLDVKPPSGTKLAVVGAGTERRRLARRYRDPAILFTGHVGDEAERIAILRAADAFFLPSSVEGLSLAMLEAMACGAATVATDVGSDGDALRGAGIVLDPVELRAELRASFRLLIENPWLIPILGEAARRRAVERYSLERNVDGLVQLYEELVG